MSAATTTRYSSKIDVWLAVVVALAALAAVFACVVLATAPVPGKWLTIVPILLLAVGLPASIYGATYYSLSDAELLIRCGPLRWRVPVRDIVEVTPTRSPLSSPALSLDRLRIDYGPGKSVMISTLERATFLRDLDARRKTAAR
jgi:hypothetical protein